VLYPLQYVVGTRWHLEARLELAVDELAAAVVQVVIVRVDGQHLLFSAGADSVAPSVAARGATENGRKGQKGIDMAKNSDRNSPLSSRSKDRSLRQLLHRSA
jgi:hypothetical protein